MMKIHAIIFVTFAVGIASLPTGRVKLDQSQQGELNVRADLQNFVIVIIPPSSNKGSELFGLLRSGLGHINKKKNHIKTEEHPEQEAQNFIESKTAPYHVDITQSKSNQEKIGTQVKKTEELLIARTPGVGKLDESTQKVLDRFARAYIITLPTENDEENVEILETSPSETKEKFLLLGAEYEQCGPGNERDENGICRVLKNI